MTEAKFDNTILNASAIITQQEAYRFFYCADKLLISPIWHIQKHIYILERMREEKKPTFLAEDLQPH
jgi:hypothetical protein